MHSHIRVVENESDSLGILTRVLHGDLASPVWRAILADHEFEIELSRLPQDALNRLSYILIVIVREHMNADLDHVPS
jgi:hypothetical protein